MKELKAQRAAEHQEIMRQERDKKRLKIEQKYKKIFEDLAFEALMNGGCLNSYLHGWIGLSKYSDLINKN